MRSGLEGAEAARNMRSRETDPQAAVDAQVFNEDRISEVYKGGVWSERLTGIARQRVNWMCSQAAGRLVLDVGCSQGIASILLARAGFDVVGIDVFPGAISYAENDAARETEAVRRRLRFVLSSLEDFDTSTLFDTAILGEVLEHQADPDAMMRQAINRLKVGGKLVLTTPFGFEPHEDHRSAIFPSWLRHFSQLGMDFEEVDVRANYIHATAIRRPNDAKVSPLGFPEIIKLTERGTLNSQKRLYSYIDQRQESIDALRDSILELEKKTQRAATLESESIKRQLDALKLSSEREQIALLGQLELSLKESNRFRSELDIVKKSAQYRIGDEIILARLSLSRALRLPFSLFGVVRDVLALRRNDQRNSAPSQRFSSGRVGAGKPLHLFLRRETQWVEFPVNEGARYRISGVMNTGRETVEKGALCLLRFKNRSEHDIPFSDETFVRQNKKGRSFCYARTGRKSSFETVIIAPRRAALMQIGFERYQETPPIHLQLAPLQELSSDEAAGASSGLISASEMKGNISTASLIAPPKSDDAPTMAVVLDEFTSDSLSPDVNLIPLSKADWREELTNRELFAFFAESAWRGNGGQWNYAMTKPEKWGKELAEIIEWCRAHKVPTIFWNKEDPANFEVFKDTARKFDHIFTTDKGCVEAYRELTGRDNVHTLAFAAQPALHNPVRFAPPINRFAFTGSWRGVKYPRRAEWLDLLLTPIMERGLLDIYDRYAGEKTNPDLVFPTKFQPALRGALEYTDLVAEVYKRYLGLVSVNSVEDSETMLARRVFEMLACGVPVVSSPSEAIEKTFGDIVLVARKADEVDGIVQRLIDEPIYRARIAAKGVRLVHSNHTYRHRLEQIATAIGKPVISKQRKKVSILCCSKRPAFLRQIADHVVRQTYEDLELIFVAHSPEFTDDSIAEAFAGIGGLKILRIGSEKVLADGLNAAIEVATGDLFAKFDDDDHYAPDYLTDSVLAFGYAPAASVVGKQSFFAYVQRTDQTVLRFPGKSYQFAKRVHGGTLVWDRRDTEGIDFTPVVQGTDTLFLRSCLANGLQIFSSDPFNFIHVRYADANNHTWKIADEEFMTKANVVGKGLLFDTAFV